MRKSLRYIVPIVLLAAPLTACGGSESSCEAMVKTGVERGSSMEDADRALRHCESVEELSQVDSEYPGLFVGTTVPVFVAARCEYNLDLRDYPICE